MKMFKIFAAAALMLSSLSVSAQETKYEFNPHWYFQGNVGAQYTLGETKMTKLISPNAQLGFGYNFNPALGLRLSVNAYQSKGAWTTDQTTVYKWNYIAPALDVTLNLSNLISGFNPKRVVDVTIFAGPEANIGFSNKEFNDFAAANPEIQKEGIWEDSYNWTGTKVRPAGHVGLDIDFKVSKRVAINLEGAANFLSDKYNSKKAGNVDWYFNALLGVKVALGKTCKPIVEPVVATPAPVAKPEPKPEPKPMVQAKKVVEKTINVFFNLRGSEISATEQAKVNEMITFLKENPTIKCTVTGYADAGTGNPKINLMYSQKRADVVTKALIAGGIAADRITTEAKGDTAQPFSSNDSNRVAIAIAK